MQSPTTRPRRGIRPVGLAAALVLAAATAILGAPAAQAAAVTCGPGGTVEDIGNGWLSSSPAYPEGGEGTSLIAAAVYDTNLIYATNGRVVMRSTDAGCGWTAVYRASEAARDDLAAAAGGEVAITALHVPSSANSSTYVYVGVTATAAGVPTPAVAVSSDRGRTFRTTDLDEGLDALGRVTEIAASPTIPQIAYVSLSTRLASVGNASIFGTSDGGQSWTARGGPAVGSTLPSQLVVDPLGQTAIYGLADGRVVRSTDGAASFRPVGGDPGGLLTRLASAPGSSGLRLAGARPDVPGISSSADAGVTWQTVPAPVSPSSIAVAPLRDLFGIAGNQVVLVPGDPAVPPVFVSPRSPGGFGSLTLTAPTGAGFAMVGLRNSAVARAALSNTLDPLPPTDGLGPVTLQPPGPLTQFPSTLLPASLAVSLPAGGSRVVPYDLLVPRTPTPVDVMFLVDSTGSMASVIEELRVELVEIVNALDNAGLNIRFGIGNYRDYPEPYGAAGRGDWPYRLDRVVGPVDEELQLAIGAIQAGGGTSDGKASPLTALVQAATGAGDVLDDVVFVDPGEGARFRPDALKLAMVAGDTEAHFGGERLPSGQTNPGPDFEDTIATLLRRDVRMMGLAVGTSPVRDFRRLADGSKSFAPAGGVDCDGDGRRDLSEGDPLVCLIGGALTGGPVTVTGGPSTGSSTGLAAALIGLAAGIPDVKPVGLAVTRGRDFARLRSVSSRPVNLRADNQLAFAVELRCPVGAASRQRIGLTAAAGSRQLATGTVDLTCGGIPVAAIAPALAGLLPVADVAVAAPAAPGQPGPNAPNPNPNPNPNANVNPATNANVNPGVAGQDQDQQQLAFAEDGEGSETLAMSGVAFVAAAGLMSCVAGGFAVRRRTSLELAR